MENISWYSYIRYSSQFYHKTSFNLFLPLSFLVSKNRLFEMRNRGTICSFQWQNSLECRGGWVLKNSRKNNIISIGNSAIDSGSDRFDSVSWKRMMRKIRAMGTRVESSRFIKSYGFLKIWNSCVHDEVNLISFRISQPHFIS